MNFILCVLGVVMIIEGAPYFMVPGMAKDALESMIRLPDNVLRALGLGLMLFGLLLLWFAQP